MVVSCNAYEERDYFGTRGDLIVSFNFSILDQLTSPMEATPPTPSTFTSLTPPTPLSPQTTVGTNSPQLPTSVGDLPSPPPTNQLKGTQAQLLSLKQFEEKCEDFVDYVLNAFKTHGVIH